MATAETLVRLRDAIEELAERIGRFPLPLYDINGAGDVVALGKRIQTLQEAVGLPRMVEILPNENPGVVGFKVFDPEFPERSGVLGGVAIKSHATDMLAMMTEINLPVLQDYLGRATRYVTRKLRDNSQLSNKAAAPQPEPAIGATEVRVSWSRIKAELQETRQNCPTLPVIRWHPDVRLHPDNDDTEPPSMYLPQLQRPNPLMPEPAGAWFVAGDLFGFGGTAAAVQRLNVIGAKAVKLLRHTTVPHGVSDPHKTYVPTGFAGIRWVQFVFALALKQEILGCHAPQKVWSGGASWPLEGFRDVPDEAIEDNAIIFKDEDGKCLMRLNCNRWFQEFGCILDASICVVDYILAELSDRESSAGNAADLEHEYLVPPRVPEPESQSEGSSDLERRMKVGVLDVNEDDKLPKRTRSQSPSRLKAKAAYDYAMEYIENAPDMVITELHAAIKDSDAAAMIPKRPDTFRRYLNDVGITRYNTGGKGVGGSIVRRSDL